VDKNDNPPVIVLNTLETGRDGATMVSENVGGRFSEAIPSRISPETIPC